MNNSIKKGVVVAVILLFIGLAFAPSINANVSKASVDSEMVEITTEVCGLKGVNENKGNIDNGIGSKQTIIIGRITNLCQEVDFITFNAKNIRCMQFFPFQFLHYKSGEKITITRQYIGIITLRFIFAVCRLTYPSSAISMNILSKDDPANEVVWMVAGVEGNPIGINDVETTLLNESGEPQPDAEITFHDANADELITPGDTFTVIAPYDGYFVFMLTHKMSGATIWKSALVKY